VNFQVLSARRPFPGLRNRAKKAIFSVSPGRLFV